MKRVRLGVAMGDPCGIGPEITARAFEALEGNQNCDLLAVGDASAMQRALSVVKSPLEINVLEDFQSPAVPGKLNLVNVPGRWDEIPAWGQISPEAGEVSIRAVELATRAALDGHIDALVTGPINKEAFWASGCEHLGHTELLGALTGVSSQDTMFVVRQTHKPGHHLRVFFATRHVSLRKAIDQLTPALLEKSIDRSVVALETLGIKNPRIALSALNPHGGENGAFGSEEIEVLKPAVADAQARGIKIVGPIPADSIFHQGLEGRFDGVIALFHDQGHIATKTYDFHGTISMTVGLPILRTSVDHGTAFDIAGTGKADPGTLLSAIQAALDYAHAVPNLKRQYSAEPVAS